MSPFLAERLKRLRTNLRGHKLAFAAITRFTDRVDRRTQLIRLDNRLSRDLDELEELYRLALSGQSSD